MRIHTLFVPNSIIIIVIISYLIILHACVNRVRRFLSLLSWQKKYKFCPMTNVNLCMSRYGTQSCIPNYRFSPTLFDATQFARKGSRWNVHKRLWANARVTLVRAELLSPKNYRSLFAHVSSHLNMLRPFSLFTQETPTYSPILRLRLRKPYRIYVFISRGKPLLWRPFV